MSDKLEFFERDRLPVWRTVKDTYGFVFGNFGAFLRIAFLPMLIVLAISYFQVRIGIISLEEDGTWPFFGRVALGLLSGIAMIPMATAWHRYAILPGKAKPSWLRIAVGREEWNFLRFAAVLFVFYLATIIVLSFVLNFVANALGSNAIGLAGVIAAIVAIVFVLCRFCLVLPAAAIGASAGLKDSWRATRGSVWRIVVVFLLIALPIAAATFLIQYLGVRLLYTPESAGPGGALYGSLLAFAWISNLLTYLVSTAVSISGLSMIFTFLTAKDRAEAA